jgi:nitrile hydratase accessory protein
MSSDERVFDEPWEAQAFALVVSLNERGLFSWSEWTEAVSAAPEEGYYERWLATLERLLTARGVADEPTLARYRHAWAHAAERTPHGTAIELAPEDFRGATSS